MDDVRSKLEAFVLRHKVILEDRGEVGFGRPCVGFIKGNGYLDYNPYRYESAHPVWPHDWRLCPPLGVSDAYHKHDCMAVLVRDDDYDEALRQLAVWVEHLEAQGEVEVVDFNTGATGFQAALTGLWAYAVRIKGESAE